ncbi:putative methyltransferase-domain-containing protein [Schizothecium vesticola]|uniref:Methyltransferase-domain-containing protein n=1 Tax=Schizothecium vesticola TaxID=314040 RepID=A0AA40K0L4_9PEZI|nr:putative methyltransferase-domain-containing protein [Schizothecium vesticola]
MGGLEGHPPPTNSLPILNTTLSEFQLFDALDNLTAIYCPAAAVPQLALQKALNPFTLSKRSAPLTDSGYSSGYTSENENDGSSPLPHKTSLAFLRADDLERTFAARWIERFLVRADDLPCFATDETRHLAAEKAADLLIALSSPAAAEDEACCALDDDPDSFWRDFTFSTTAAPDITIRINDGLAGKSASDHLDVGLQTWGASIVFCQMLCNDLGRFGLTTGRQSTIVELGAGTGLVSLALGKLLPALEMRDTTVVATDYHPAVIANLQSNIAANGSAVVGCVLDWAREEVDDAAWPVEKGEKVEVLVATDVVYESTHAVMLHECAERLLAEDGVFWLMQTVRQNGRFGEVADAVGEVFGEKERAARGGGKALRILERERVERMKGVGRGDEAFYRLFKVGWA